MAFRQNLHMSVATLRRHLDDEGTNHRDIVDRVRRDLACAYLKDPRLAVTEVAFLLGFANVQAFSRAFRRWTRSSPVEFRTQLVRQPALSA